MARSVPWLQSGWRAAGKYQIVLPPGSCTPGWDNKGNGMMSLFDLPGMAHPFQS